ncbi:TonB-dependent receptor [Paraurantiacibacter namhicola]|uniref:Catecholate siderophore receptor CirA n=1 Tax=Paraurantiacibacter namhicola TaxID=645517 RepID=A0A1C7D7D9_9SPHN|nr:TonB-dependent receptor [Paraurantiacibacter namhicola]ANU07223.1 catecholate siderophore receptor CirA [Paraurantiacibacter namhicola]
MKNSTGIRLTTALLLSGSMFAISAPAAAQSPEQQAEDDAPETTGNTIIVTGIRASIQGATNAKRNSDQIKDVIDAEDIGELPDTNVAEALQRVTGVQINRDQGEGSEIAVRGFSQNRVEVNGQTQVGSTADGNVSFNAIPSEAFKSIEVIKTPAADEIEGALGAIVRFNTRQPLDRKGFTFSARAEAQYAERADAWTPNFNVLVADNFEVGNGAGEAGFLVSYTRKHRKLRQDFFRVRGYEALDGLGLDLDGDGVAGELIERNSDGIITDLQDGAYLPTQTLFRVTEQDRKLDSWTAAFQYQPAPGFELYVNGTYSRNRADDRQYQATARLNNAYSPDGMGGFAINNRFSDIPGLVISPNQTIRQAFLGGFNNRGRAQGIGFGISGASNPPEQDILTVQAGAKFKIGSSLDGQVQLSFGKGKRFQRYINTTSGIGGTDSPFFFINFDGDGDVPDYIPLQSEVGGVPVTGFSEDARFDFNDPSIYTFNNIAINEDTDRTQEQALRLDFDYDTGNDTFHTIEFGARYARVTGVRGRLRARDARGAADGTLGDTDYDDLLQSEPGLIVQLPFDDYLDGATGDQPDSFLLPDPQFLVDNRLRLLDTYGIILQPDESFGYDAERKTAAAYVKLNFDFDVGSIPVFGNVGVRYVHTSRNSSGPAPDPNAVQFDEDVLIFQSESLKYHNWLPSLNLVATPFDNFYVRFGAAKAMARPDLQDASPLLIVSDSFDRARGGNPFLLPEEVTQFDLSLEKYYGDSNLIAVALFYKRYDERIEDGVTSVCLPIADDQSEFTPGTDGCLVGQDLIRAETPVNVGGAEVKGVEVSWQQSLDFLPSPLDGFGFIANYTYVDAGFGSLSATGLQLPVQDLSEHSYNLIGYYEKGPISARVAYNWRSEFYDERTDTNQASFARPYGQLDASIGFDVTNKIKLSFEAVNILNEPEERYQELLERPLEYTVNDRRFVIGVTFRN